MKTVTFKEQRLQESNSGLACVQQPPPFQEIGEGGRNLNWKGTRVANTKAERKSGAMRGERQVSYLWPDGFSISNKAQRAGICEWHM